MSDPLVTQALLFISKNPGDFDHVKKALTRLVEKTVQRERKRLEKAFRREDWGNGEDASFETRSTAISYLYPEASHDR